MFASALSGCIVARADCLRFSHNISALADAHAHTRFSDDAASVQHKQRCRFNTTPEIDRPPSPHRPYTGRPVAAAGNPIYFYVRAWSANIWRATKTRQHVAGNKFALGGAAQKRSDDDRRRPSVRIRIEHKYVMYT